MTARSEATRTPLSHYWGLLSTYLRPQFPAVMLLTVLILSSIALQLVNPQIMRDFIDMAQAGSETERLVKAAVLFLAIAIVQQVVSVLAAFYSESIGWAATNALRADLADHCLRLDMSFHNRHTPGEMIERIDGDVTALTNFFSQFVIQMLGNALLLLGILLLLLREDWRVGLVLAAFASVTVFVLGRFRNVAVPHWTAERQASADLFGFLEERLAGTEDIRANGGEAYVMRRFYELMRELMKRSLKAALMVNILLNSSFFLFTLGTAAAFSVGALLFQDGTLSIGSVYIIFHYTTMLERPIRQITRQMEDLQRAGAGIMRTQELLSTRSKIQDSEQGTPLPALPLAVEFQRVSFGYECEPTQVTADTGRHGTTSSTVESKAKPGEMVLHDLSFRLEPGTVLGLLGRTGSGKTTLTRLLFRLYDPGDGAILMGGQANASATLCDIRQVPLQNLRQRVGMVTQNIELFHATMRDNLTFFDDRISDEMILNVIQDLGLGPWVQSLPQGLHTVLESGGGGLSAGEAQLLAFTRIFLQDPSLVILDEASSRLDPATEHLIERAVDKLVQGRTAIIIAHRLGTVQRADEIMILEDGRIAEHGPRVKLVDDPSSHFYSLLQVGLEEVLA